MENDGSAYDGKCWTVLELSMKMLERIGKPWNGECWNLMDQIVGLSWDMLVSALASLLHKRYKHGKFVGIMLENVGNILGTYIKMLGS